MVSISKEVMFAYLIYEPPTIDGNCGWRLVDGVNIATMSGTILGL